MTKPKGPRKPKAAKPRKVIPIVADKSAGAATISVQIGRLKIGKGSRGGTKRGQQRYHGGRPTAKEQEIRRTARETILRTRERIGRESEKAFETLRDAHRGKIADPQESMARQRAANSLLNKAGLGDTSKLEVTTDRPVTVQFGEMKGHPSPRADVNGVEPDGSVADAVNLDDEISDPEPHDDPAGA